jgi:hypothetical protein
VKKYFLVAGIALVIVLIGVILTPQGTRLFALAGERALARGQGAVSAFSDLRTLLGLTLPRAAAYVTDALLVVLAALGLLFIHLLVMVPVQLHGLQRQVRSLDEQTNALRQELAQANALLREAAERLRQTRRLHEGGIVTKSPLGPVSPSPEMEL